MNGGNVFGSDGVHHNWRYIQAVAKKVIDETYVAGNFGYPARVVNGGAPEPVDVVLPLAEVAYETPAGTALSDENIGQIFATQPANVLQTATAAGVTFTLVGDQAGAEIGPRVDGVMLPDASDDQLAIGASAQAVQYTLTFSPPLTGLVIEARDFLLLSGRERRMTNFNIAPDSVTGTLDLTAGVVKGSANSGDGTLVFPPATEISTLTFTVEGRAITR